MTENVARWQDKQGAAIAVHALALSDYSGAGRLGIPATQPKDWALASLLDGTARAHSTFAVEVRRLDEFLRGPIGVLKIDVEGHELGVLRGADALLNRTRKKQIF